MVSTHSLELQFYDYDVYFDIVFLIIVFSLYCFYEPQFMRIYCSNTLLYLIHDVFSRLLGQSGAHCAHATVSLLSINILGQLTLVNMTRMGGCPRAPGSFPSHPCRLQTPFARLQSPFFGSGFHFSDSRFHFSRFIAGF